MALATKYVLSSRSTPAACVLLVHTLLAYCMCTAYALAVASAYAVHTLHTYCTCSAHAVHVLARPALQLLGTTTNT